MSIEKKLDAFHTKVKSFKFLHYFTAFNRVVLAIAFIPSGMTKVLGLRFTKLPLDNPVGFFFEAFYQAHGWYRFVGIAQVLAAVLLLIPRSSTLGATIFFPIVLNIMVITISVGFKGTWVITVFMFLANLYLICWDYDKFKLILPFPEQNKTTFSYKSTIPLTIIGAIGGTLAFALFAAISPAFSNRGILLPLTGFLSGGIFGFLNSLHLQKELSAAKT